MIPKKGQAIKWLMIALLFVCSMSFGPLEGMTTAGIPHLIYGEVQNGDGSKPAEEALEFIAYIQTRSGEILTESGVGCGYQDGWWWAEVGNFESAWDIDEILTIVFANPANGEGNAVDVSLSADGNQTPSSPVILGIGGTTAIYLDEGWNLISLPLLPSDNAISTVLSSLAGQYASVWAYVAGSWKVYDPGDTGLRDLTSMDAGWGYWLDMNESATLAVSGFEPSDSIALESGWNLVGYHGADSQPMADALSSIDGKYVKVWAYMGGHWKMYDTDSPGFNDLTNMERGYGYWIDVTEPCTWRLP